MINYYHSEITQILPEGIKKSPEVIAVSHAIGKNIRKLLEFSKKICVYANIEAMSEKELDLLSTELRAPYYLEDMNIDQKRKIIKNSLLWHKKAGTPYAVEELIKTVFGEGEIHEWFEYGGEPFTFRIETETVVTEDIIKYFNKIIRTVKNTRSHMEAIELKRTYEDNMYISGVFKAVKRETPISEEGI